MCTRAFLSNTCTSSHTDSSSRLVRASSPDLLLASGLPGDTWDPSVSATTPVSGGSGQALSVRAEWFGISSFPTMNLGG